MDRLQNDLHETRQPNAIRHQKDRYEIITFTGSFHGRTLATLAAANNEKYLEGFEPKLGGFKSATFNDIESVRKLINKKTAAILVEPIQGEGGIIPADKKFMKELRKIANENDLLLALYFDGLLMLIDEVELIVIYGEMDEKMVV